MASKELIDKLLNPRPEYRDELLEQLGLAHPPSEEEIIKEIEQKFLEPRLPTNVNWQVHWDEPLDIDRLLVEDSEPAPPATKLEFVRGGLNGEFKGWREVLTRKIPDAHSSTSLDRAPSKGGSKGRDFVRGKSGNVPFWPGGLEPPEKQSDAKMTDDEFLGLVGKLKTIPPGFTRGLKLKGEVEEEEEEEFKLDLEVEDGDPLGIGEAPDEDIDFPDDKLKKREEESLDAVEEIDELLPSSVPPVASSSKSSQSRPQAAKRDWAHVIDVSRPFRDFHQKVPHMAHKYPFELDTFQKHAVYHLEKGDSVFVAAHTSAGKTVVAEYAIALAGEHMTRAIYTSPIKALSNQKFRDFQITFSSSQIGILTGDVQINAEAPCLIMTTEILRSMLYKGADLIRDVEFVIFDEVHYVSDAERGVVWEEVIIMLPEHVSIILLSATIPNTREFAEWVGRTKKKNIYVISTLYRPVPLEHYLYAGRETYKIVDQKGQFISQGYKDAGEALRRKQDKEREAAGLPPVQKLGAAARANPRGGPANRGGRGGQPPANRGGGGGQPPTRGGGGGSRGGGPVRTFHTVDKNLYVHLLGHLRKKSLLPVVVFVFSKKKCEEYASTLVNADLCTALEKSEIHVAIEKALSRLKAADRTLPQIARMRDLLSRGIGVHHGGLLPIVKEVVEILFGRGLVKVLFATETFAMGVNMPARSVVFASIRKHDGRSFRELLPGEYTQMSGRAGRRGLDTTGTVIITCDSETPELPILHKMILGKPANLQSQFRLTYNMILNLLRVEALRVEEMIKRSFSENAAQRLLPEQQKQINEEELSLSKLPRLSCEICQQDLKDYYEASDSYMKLTQRLVLSASVDPRGSKWFSPGRVILIRNTHFPVALAVLLKPLPFQPIPSSSSVSNRIFYVLARVSQEVKDGAKDVEEDALTPRAGPTFTVNDLKVDEPVYDLKEIKLSDVLVLCDRTIKVDVDAITERHRISAMKEVVRQLSVLVGEWESTDSISNGGKGAVIPEIELGRIRSFEFQEDLQKRESMRKGMSGRACVLCENFGEHYNLHHTLRTLQARIQNLKFFISDQNLELLPDYEQRVGVLHELGFVSESGTVTLKGRVACEINSGDELVLTELILENTLAPYEPSEIVSLLSCFVFQEKTQIDPVLTPHLNEGRAFILEIADRVDRVQDLWKVGAVEGFGGGREGEGRLKGGLMEVVYEWARGMPFAEIMSLTDVPEGTIVRCITRLDEVCREVRDAARVIGDAELFRKMENAQELIKRDIVFAASLYF